VTERLAFRCKFCGTLDSIVEVQLIPSIQRVLPEQGGTPFEDVDYGSVVTFYEDPPVLGFGCEVSNCVVWQGQWGNALDRASQPTLQFHRAEALSDIAQLVRVNEHTETIVEVTPA